MMYPPSPAIRSRIIPFRCRDQGSTNNRLCHRRHHQAYQRRRRPTKPTTALTACDRQASDHHAHQPTACDGQATHHTTNTKACDGQQHQYAHHHLDLRRASPHTTNHNDTACDGQTYDCATTTNKAWVWPTQPNQLQLQCRRGQMQWMKQKQMPTYYFVDLFTGGNYAVAEAEDAVLPAPRRGSGMSATRRCCADALLPTPLACRPSHTLSGGCGGVR